MQPKNSVLLEIYSKSFEALDTICLFFSKISSLASLNIIFQLFSATILGKFTSISFVIYYYDIIVHCINLGYEQSCIIKD